MLPPELGSLVEPEDQATEYMHYRQFFNVWELLARVVETQALEQPQMNKDTRAVWLSDYKVRTHGQAPAASTGCGWMSGIAERRLSI